MADAVCGPSNALQSFQKHSSVDRTLQQDRLVGRHSPSQGFRSSPSPNAGALDQEFEAFQAGHVSPPQPRFRHLPPPLARPPPPQSAQSLQAPDWASDWASDFQRLSISHTEQAPHQRIPAPNAATSWHQDFMNQQGPRTHVQSSQQHIGLRATNGLGVSSFVRPGFQPASFDMMNGKSTSKVSQGKQRAPESVPQIDEEAFERAFAAVQQAEEEAYAESQAQQNPQPEDAAVREILQEEEDAALSQIRERRPAVYAAIKIRSAVELETPLEASQFLDVLEKMETSHELTKDASEARWVVDSLQQIADHNTLQQIKTRSEALVRAINERLMSTYPLLSTPVAMNQDRIWEELEAVGYKKTRESDQTTHHESRPEQQEEQRQPQHDDDEMAQTAGHLLERVSDNTSEKFKNSQFLSLMRRLRDREVRVEGDKMVEVSTTQSTSLLFPSAPHPTQSHVLPQSVASEPATSIEHFNDIYPPSGMDWGWYDPPSPTVPSATTVPPVDPNILDYAATDFVAPVYLGEGQQ